MPINTVRSFGLAGVVAALPLLIIGLWVRERKMPVKKQPISLEVFRGPLPPSW